MPRGRRRRRGVMNFMFPCLLLMLSRDDAHGYSLLDGLDEFGIDKEWIDPSLIYRALREMEEAGWVTSTWGEESQGPRRRVYRILPEGRARLAERVKDLHRTRDQIDRLLQAYEREIQPD